MKQTCLGFMMVALLCLAACGGGADSDQTAALAEDAIFQDTFSPNTIGPWFLEGDEGGRTAVINEELVIAIDQPNTIQYSALQDLTFADYALEVDARMIAGDLESSYGILARMQNPDQFYRFEITGSGLYMIERRNGDGTWTHFLTDWSPSEAINQGLNVPNRLKVVAQGSKMSFFINDMLVHQIDDVIFTSGGIALDAGTFGRPGLQVAFDNLLISEPE